MLLTCPCLHILRVIPCFLSKYLPTVLISVTVASRVTLLDPGSRPFVAFLKMPILEYVLVSRNLYQVKVKFVLEQTMKAQRGSRSIVETIPQSLHLQA